MRQSVKKILDFSFLIPNYLLPSPTLNWSEWQKGRPLR
jgi:hypothetical protein